MGYYYPGAYIVFPSDTIYFITITVIDWVDVFTRDEYKSIVAESLDFCRRKKGLNIHAWVLMTNHLHLIVSHEIDNEHLWDVIRDFKKFTSKAVISAIIDNPVESRKRWILKHFEEENISTNEDASCSVSKKGVGYKDYDCSDYPCDSCRRFPMDCNTCLKEMRHDALSKAGNKPEKHYHLWQRGYDKYCIYNIKHMRQKLDYLHENPIRAGIVFKPWEYRYSSYPNYCGDEGLIEIDYIDLGIDDPTKSSKW